LADPTSPVVAPATTTTRYWEAVVTIDPTLDIEPDPDTPCPTDTPERTFPLDLPENLIGRRSAARGILPQIALSDPGASHRHLMVYRNPDTGLLLSDLGSTNGTFLNGSADRLEPGVKTPVADGDRIELGRWTRITFRQHT
jgi:pSer/pThr/pTyr-binding forkhead associated (FHA) protein